MKKTFKIIITLLIVVGISGGIIAMVKSKEDKKNDKLKTVEVKRGNVIDKALAVGSIEPKVEVDVKSKISGVVKKLFVESGDYVNAGDPLLEIKPTPTPEELVNAQQQVERKDIDLKNALLQYNRQKKLKNKGFISDQQFDQTKKTYDQAKLELQSAKDQLELLKEGKLDTGTEKVESVVKAPISGYILEKEIEIGDPVVPLTSYQAGTVLMTMANMKNLLFKGTVDEIDVGKLKEGMPATLKIGALPDAVIKGVVSKISLKSDEKDNSVVFPIQITLTKTHNVLLRAGYSANAEITVTKHDDVLTIPERLVSFSGDTARVELALNNGKTEERIIKTGLSDAMNIEVKDGLKNGDKVVERPPKEIK
ncbi:MAG TPA: efflux RND transporter periplasmic adaptor subunit [Balneolales bacterium]|nr:efflux RND transporter periplasmic adaptor subunit [Balneolales bacterium]